MGWNQGVALIREVANAKLIEIGDTSLSIAMLVTGLIILYVTWTMGALTRRTTVRALQRTGLTDPATQAIISRLARYTVLFIGISIALETVGVDLGGLFTAGAVFAVGIGFAMQNIAQNFVSGLILLVERSIKPGDILEVEGKVVKVIELGIRACLARTREDEELIIPNASLVQSIVTNYTLHDSQFRLRVAVGVAYESNMKQVYETLKACADGVQWRLDDPEPVVLMTEFADSSVNFEVSVWVDDPWRERTLASRLRMAVWDALAEAGIVIAFPQMDVHFDANVLPPRPGQGALAPDDQAS